MLFFVLAIRMALLLLLSWYKRKSNKKKKSRLNVSGPTPERSFWYWKMNSLRFTTLKQHFSAPPVHSSAHAPPPRPFLFYAKALRCWLLFFGFWGKICIHKNLLENGLKKECEFLKTIRILQACNSHIADWLFEYFFIFLVFFFIPSRRCCRAVFLNYLWVVSYRQKISLPFIK